MLSSLNGKLLGGFDRQFCDALGFGFQHEDMSDVEVRVSAALCTSEAFEANVLWVFVTQLAHDYVFCVRCSR